MAPIFLRPDQEFVWGLDLKADLAKIDNYYRQFPENEKAKGVMSFAHFPPDKPVYLVTTLWNKHIPNWNKPGPKGPPMNPELQKRIVEELEKHSKAPPLTPNEIDFDSDSAQFLMVRRVVNRKKGSWLIINDEEGKETKDVKGS